MGGFDDIPDSVFTDVELGIDDKSIEDTKKKIKQAFSKSGMGPVGLDFDVGSGVGGIFDQVTSQFKDNKIPTEDIFDSSGLGDLFGALNNAKDTRSRTQIERAINQELTIRRELANLQKAAATQMFQAAYQYTSMSETAGTIEIEAQGLEPEMEAFMWKLLKKIQVRANKSGAEFLLAAT